MVVLVVVVRVGGVVVNVIIIVHTRSRPLFRRRPDAGHVERVVKHLLHGAHGRAGLDVDVAVLAAAARPGTSVVAAPHRPIHRPLRNLGHNRGPVARRRCVACLACAPAPHAPTAAAAGKDALVRRVVATTCPERGESERVDCFFEQQVGSGQAGARQPYGKLEYPAKGSEIRRL